MDDKNDKNFFDDWCLKFKFAESTKIWLKEQGCDCDTALKSLTEKDIPYGPASDGVANLGERNKILTGVASLQAPTRMCFCVVLSMYHHLLYKSLPL